MQIKYKTEKLHYIYLILIIIVGPILDLMTGIYERQLGISSILSPGIIYRGMILLPFFIFCIFRLRIASIKFISYLLIVIFFLSILLHSSYNDNINFVGSLQKYLKIIFPILGFGALYYLGEQKFKIRDDKFLWLIAGSYGLLYVLLILFLFAFGWGFSTYRHGFSFVGFYSSQNPMGFIFTTSFLCLFYYFYKYNNYSLYICIVIDILYIFCAFLVGTRALILGVPFAAVMVHFFVIIRPKKELKFLWFIYGLLLFLIILIILNYIYNYWMLQDVNYQLKKFQYLIEGNFRSRVPAGLDHIKNFTFIQHLFGVGDLNFKLTENDLIDIYGKFGLLTLSFSLTFFFYFYFKVLVKFFRNKSFQGFVLTCSMTFYLVHGSLAGHMFTTAQTNNLMMLIYYLSYRFITKN